METKEMTKFQLIDAMIGDLGDKDRGLQVQGYRNLKIVTAAIEALVALKEGLSRDEEDMRRMIEAKDAELADLRRLVAERDTEIAKLRKCMEAIEEAELASEEIPCEEEEHAPRESVIVPCECRPWPHKEAGEDDH